MNNIGNFRQKKNTLNFVQTDITIIVNIWSKESSIDGFIGITVKKATFIIRAKKAIVNMKNIMEIKATISKLSQKVVIGNSKVTINNLIKVIVIIVYSLNIPKSRIDVYFFV